MTKTWTAALWLALAVPALTVCASAITLVLAYRGADPELPARYATEGAALDADLARARAARDRRIELNLDIDARGIPRLRYASAAGHAAPAVLRLRLTHATQPGLELAIELASTAHDRNLFVAGSVPIAAGRWHVEVDAGAQWRLRGILEAMPGSLRLGEAGDAHR